MSNSHPRGRLMVSAIVTSLSIILALAFVLPADGAGRASTAEVAGRSAARATPLATLSAVGTRYVGAPIEIRGRTWRIAGWHKLQLQRYSAASRRWYTIAKRFVRKGRYSFPSQRLAGRATSRSAPCCSRGVGPSRCRGSSTSTWSPGPWSPDPCRHRRAPDLRARPRAHRGQTPSSRSARSRPRTARTSRSRPATRRAPSTGGGTARPDGGRRTRRPGSPTARRSGPPAPPTASTSSTRCPPTPHCRTCRSGT